MKHLEMVVSDVETGRATLVEHALLKDIQRESYDGIGKPEPLKGNLSG